MRDIEKAHFERVLKMTNGNQAKANELMDYGSINRFRARIKEYGIEIETE
jgi:DNA-binding protein Fis